MRLAEGEVFAGYNIVRQLGYGAMGEVYLAQHPRLPRRDALKLLARDVSADESFRERFLREADLASTLWHPNIVGVHDRGEHEGQLWLSMDFVDGLDAGRLLSQRFPGGMPQELVVEIVTAVAAGLDYAHKQGLLHRDVKPGNIMVTNADDAGERRILLTDFGIARMVDDISGLTATNFTVGTVAYTAPEQLSGQDLDGRADQYSLAATAYHLLTGSQLFAHSNAAVVIGRHLTAAPPALADTRPGLAAVDSALAVALSKDPGDRFLRCGDFARALAEQVPDHRVGKGAAPSQPAPTQPAVATPAALTPTPAATGEPKPAAHSVRLSHRRALSVASALAVILAVVAAVSWLTWGHRRTGAAAPGTTTTPTAVKPPIAAGAPMAPTSSPPPPPPTFPASAIDSLMLSPPQVSSLTGGAFHGASPGEDMIVSSSSYGMSDNGAQVRPPSCVGVIFGAEHPVYAGTGFQEIRDQTLDPSTYTTGHQVEQTAVVFPSADKAQALLDAQTTQWQTCANLPSGVPGTTGMQMGQRHGEGGYTWTLSDVTMQPGMITVKMAGYDNEAGSDQACQQALGVRANVLVKVRACQDVSTTSLIFQDTSLAGNYGQVLARAMLQRVTI